MTKKFEPNHILHDRYLQAASPFDTQGFLEELESELADVALDGEPVSALLERVAAQQKIDVRVLLAKLQVEQGLLTTTNLTDDKLDWAMGYGLTDEERFEEFKGFATQLEMAARALTGYLKEDHPFSVVGQIGQPMNVRDGLVVPQNLATAALYRYTPWIGSSTGGDASSSANLGNALFFRVWLDLFDTDPRSFFVGVPSSEDGVTDAARYPQDKSLQAFPPLRGRSCSASSEPDAKEPAAPEKRWKIISPPDNWRNPIVSGESGLAVLEEVSRRLGLVTTRDEQRSKYYVGLPRPQTKEPSEPPTGKTIKYPSGRVFQVVEPSWAVAAIYAPAVPGAEAPLIAADDDAPLSQHFKMGEFRPHDPQYRYLRVLPDLVQLLEQLRSAVGYPLIVNSGYRPKAYNAGVGGAPLSTHIDGLAADISCLSIPVSTLHEKADALVGERGGVGYYPSQEFVHVDLRGTHVRWSF